MSEPSVTPVGLSGYLCTATRGPAGAGEVVLRIRGGTETFTARSREPLAVGREVIVVEHAGPRTVVVEALDAADSDPSAASDHSLEL